MKNISTFLLFVFFNAIVFAQINQNNKQVSLVGTWKTTDGQTLKINKSLIGSFDSQSKSGEIRTLTVTANQLTLIDSIANYSVNNFYDDQGKLTEPVIINNDSIRPTAISMSLRGSNGNITSTMTGQVYLDIKNDNKTTLQVFHVLQENTELACAETLFFVLEDSSEPEISSKESSISNITQNLIGSWKDSYYENRLNIVYIKDQQIYATYKYLIEENNSEILINLKGFINQSDDNNFTFSLSGISPQFNYDVNSTFSISLSGRIKAEGNSYHCNSSMNIAHAYGSNVNYSSVESQGAYFTKDVESTFEYSIIENKLIRLPFTNNGASNWVSLISIGGDNKQFNIALDTGGNFDWVNSTSCTSDVCVEGHTQFDPNYTQNNTFDWINKLPTGHDWGPWGKSKAKLGFDVLNIQPNNINTPVFKETNLITEFIAPEGSTDLEQFKELLWDGALAMPSYSSGGMNGNPDAEISNIIIDLVTAGLVDPNNVNISFYYDEDSGKFEIGDVNLDPKKIDIESKVILQQDDYYDSIKGYGDALSYLWSTPLKSVKVGGKSISGIDSKVTRFAFDTGASSLKGDTAQMKNLLKLVESGNPDIEYTMGKDKNGRDAKFIITSNQYNKNIDTLEYAGTKQIQIQPLDNLPDLWLQGTTLLQDLYTVFKYDVSFNEKGELVLNAREVNLYNKKEGPKIIQKSQDSNLVDLPHKSSFEIYDSLWRQGTNDNMNWHINSGRTKTYGTGPSSATHGDRYYYIEADHSHRKYAYLNSPRFNLDNPIEINISFKYHMWAFRKLYVTKWCERWGVKYPCGVIEKEPMGSLQLQVKKGRRWSTIWHMSGNQGRNWKYVKNLRVGLKDTNGSVQFRFKGTIGIDNLSDIAIDNIKIESANHLFSKTSENEKIISDKVLVDEIFMYPNPVNSDLEIFIPSTDVKLGDSTISITNILGKVVGIYNYKESANSLNIDMSKYKDGTYFVKISNLEGVTIKKIIKMK